jgi:hypothetical protein
MGSKESKDDIHFRIRAQKSRNLFFEPVEIQWAQINLSGLSCSLIGGSEKTSSLPHYISLFLSVFMIELRLYLSLFPVAQPEIFDR